MTVLSITDVTGTKTVTIHNGSNGITPIKGIDYFTQSDIDDIVTLVYNKIGESDKPNDNPDTPAIDIPNYHYVESGRVTQRLLNLKSQYPNHIVFGAIADTHIDIDNETVKTSANHALFALKSVGMSAQCDFITNLGDNIANSGLYKDEVLVQSAYDSMTYMEDISKDALTSIHSYNLIGNHDKGENTQELYDFIGEYNHQEGKLSFDDCGLTKIRGYGYKDYENKKVRVICLNTCDYWNAQGGNGMSYEQKDWFMRSLDLSSKSDFEDWLIIVLSHIPLDFKGGDYNKGDDLKKILVAYMDGTAVSIPCVYDYAKAENELDLYEGVTLEYDYNGINSPKIVNIHGHLHNNIYGKLKFIDDNKELDIVRISTGSSTQAPTDERYTADGYYSISTEEKDKIEKISGTEKDTSATFYFIDLDNQIVHSVGYGADIDRSISIDVSKNTYNVVYNLTNCSSSTTITKVIEGENYSTTIILDEDSSVSTVLIKMGGVDITDTAYSDGVITIDNISGDIEISVIATIQQFEYIVSDLSAAGRMEARWYPDGTEISIGNGNEAMILCTSKENEMSFVSRSSNTFYYIPVPEKATKVTVSTTDASVIEACFTGINRIDDLNNKVFSYKGTELNYSFTKGSCQYMLISLYYPTDSKTGWDSDIDISKYNVTFTNY